MRTSASVSHTFSLFLYDRDLDDRENETCDGEEEQDQRDDETRDNHADYSVREHRRDTRSNGAAEDIGSKREQRNQEVYDELRHDHT